VQANKTKLGWSFEANITAVENQNADPLVVTGLDFTGAAIILASPSRLYNFPAGGSSTPDLPSNSMPTL
jgi:hypothetical protein